MLFSTGHESVYLKVRAFALANIIRESGRITLERPLVLFCRCKVAPAANFRFPPPLTKPT